MLQKLSIKNYALIAELQLNWNANLTIITGETGAGKSILLGALGLLLGDRADSDVLFDKNKKCVVEADFNIDQLELEDFFASNELDYDTKHCVIRREIAPGGKSRAFINDTPVTLPVLRLLTAQLVDLHRQHETLELNSSKFQLTVIDALAHTMGEVALYKKAYLAYQKDLQQLEKLKTELQRLQNEQDYLQYQFNELSEARLLDNESTELENEQQLLTNAGIIKSTLASTSGALTLQDDALVTQLKTITQHLQSVSRLKPELADLHKRLQSCIIELQDIAAELESEEEKLTVDSGRLQIVNDRLDLIFKLLKKHGAKDTTELLTIQQDLSNKLLNVTQADDNLHQLESAIAKQKNQLSNQAEKISNQRKNAIGPFEKECNQLLEKVGMPHARLKVEHQPLNQLGANGIDEIRFMFTANKGSALQELNKVASGGELSRLMLCMKSLVASSTHLPTIVFDEIDTGVSGEVAKQVGVLLGQLAKRHQVICITHLPQIAARGQAHYYVYKQAHATYTQTLIRELNTDERKNEIAIMLSGNPPSPAALSNATELMAIH